MLGVFLSSQQGGQADFAREVFFAVIHPFNVCVKAVVCRQSVEQQYDVAVLVVELRRQVQRCHLCAVVDAESKVCAFDNLLFLNDVWCVEP